jgi:hypothetical protein
MFPIPRPANLGPLSCRLSPTELGRAFTALLAAYPEPPPVEVEATVAIPAGAGLGCSAALGVAVQRALDQALGLSRTDGAVAEASMAWERVFHGTPSGIDSALASAGGVRCFRRGQPLEAVPIGRPLHLVVADSGEHGSTKAMVASVRRQHERDPKPGGASATSTRKVGRAAGSLAPSSRGVGGTSSRRWRSRARSRAPEPSRARAASLNAGDRGASGEREGSRRRVTGRWGPLSCELSSASCSNPPAYSPRAPPLRASARGRSPRCPPACGKRERRTGRGA